MKRSDVTDALKIMASKSEAGEIIRYSAFTRRFFPRLPALVRNDVIKKVVSRKQRKNPTKENLIRSAENAVRFGLKFAPFIEDKFPFVDSRNKAKSQPLTHAILMRDDAIQKLAKEYADKCSSFLTDEVSIEKFSSYLDALEHVYKRQRAELNSIYVQAPKVNFKNKDKKPSELEQSLQIAILKMQNEEWIEGRLIHLRSQYIEFAQIALDRVGENKHQQPYISTLSFANWMQKQREARDYLESMAVMNEETDEAFNLEDVVKRTTANPENRRIEMMVRSRGFEEVAQDLGYTALFLTWTLPSKYHRNSAKWNGSSVKEGHKALMKKWAIGRAELAKLDIDYFGFRVAEPHKDATSHAHYFLFCAPEHKEQVIEILRERAISEDRDELGSDTTKRFDVKEADPKQGGATAYIAKYVSKNINGSHMPESDAEQWAYRARAWASTHRIRQFQQFGGEPVSLWRNLRRATPAQTSIDPKLEELRQVADSSKWSLFCQLAASAQIEYEDKQNKYGEITKKVIGFSWLGKLIETCSESYCLVKKKDVKRLQEARSASPWSTENNCNSHLVEDLQRMTGWSVRGVKCLVEPLKRGAKVPIDKDMTIRLRDGRLEVT
ncbi:replication endonuclease [Vibrio parahaemolyticus]|uniref:replication endonuclease n=1 Tax=Vibrio parahaemolyticus TaxID=670 RepID=UPI00084AB3A4|nr:replication endonuclease [Vibrio parahaemolyticus]EIV8648094.1 replication endonuclease [Vibrio parahaemolyticus]EJE4732854.1 replication endonuclease [Vibrio parahaemolyticus]ODZ41975.1 replication protein [Vibrio parahaemolyticus]